MSLRIGRWWHLLAALAATLLVAAVAACGDDDEEGGGGGGERIEGGELTVQGFEFQSLDPHFSASYTDITVERMLWRGLYTLDIDNVPQPAMAASAPEVSDDGLTYTVTLRDGLKWSDGDDLTADDFVAGIYRTCNPDNAGQYAYNLFNIVGCNEHYTNEAGFDEGLEEAIAVRAVDATTIEFTLAKEQPTFPIILSLWMTFPSPVHLFPNSSDEWPSGEDAPERLAYNGPYVLESYRLRDSISLTPNTQWAAPAGVSPTLERVTIKFIDDLASATNAYRTGELQATGADDNQLDAAISEFGEGEEYFAKVQASTIALFLQVEVEPLDQLEVRLALSQAIDRGELNRVVYKGGHAPTTSWIPEVTGGDAPDAFEEDIGFDPDKAKDNLAEAGFAGGEGFPELSLIVVDSPDSTNTGEFLQQAFKTHLNIDITIETVDFPTLLERLTEEQYEMIDFGWLQDYPDPENWVLGQFETEGTLNHFNCSDPDIDDLIDAARFNANDDERRGQYKELNQLIVTRLCGVVPYRHASSHWLIKPEVVGMRENLSGQDGTIAADWAAEYWGLSE